MRVLLVHPEDSPIAGSWSDSRWDLVVDLGWAGTSQYAIWSEKLKCPIRGLYSFSEWHEGVDRIRDIWHAGSDYLVDGHGIDWWNLLAPMHFQEIYDFILLSNISHQVDSTAEVRITRPHRLADTLGKLLGVNVVPFVKQSPPLSAWVRRYTRALRTLTSAQVAGIALDKWDLDYRFRRFLHGPKRSSNLEHTVLLPSSYRNVSRVLAAYASLLPDRRFLLVTTRSEGAIRDLPGNVNSVPLAAYAPLPRNTASEREIATLSEQWCVLQRRLEQSKDPVVSYAGSLFPNFAHTLRVGVRIRDAWREVLNRERINSVLCGDENNPYTRLPILLARSRGSRTVYCSHGALDVNILLRGVCSETYLAKGEMESDYLVKECGVPWERIVVGAPPGPYFGGQGEGAGTHIVFFSEPYELYYGRTETLYRELLPRLCAVAREHGRRVMVKLHPFESLTGRRHLVERVLGDDDRKLVEVIAGPFSERLLRKIWFSLTVESSVAVECTLAGVPSFLCGWFDIDLYSYGKQYERFGAARILDEPSDISRVPELLGSQRPGAEVRNRLYTPITRADFEAVLQGKATAPSKT